MQSVEESFCGKFLCTSAIQRPLVGDFFLRCTGDQCKVCWPLLCVDLQLLTILAILVPVYQLSSWLMWRTLTPIARKGEGLVMHYWVDKM